MQGYNEMIRKVKPKAVICYGEPFEEMQGRIIPIDYAKTNNLSPKSNKDIFYIKKTCGYVCCEKGMGSAISNKKFLYQTRAQLKHIFGNRKGHVPDTPDNRQKLVDLANDSSKYLGKDKYGNSWHSEIDTNGNQWWVRFMNQIINEGGMNTVPKPWDSETGLNFNPFK